MRQFSRAATTAACQAKHRQSNIMLVHNIERSTGGTALKCWTPTCSCQQPFCSSSLQLGIPVMLHCVLNPKTHQKVEASKWRTEQNIGQKPATWHPNPDRRIPKNTKEHAPIIHCIFFAVYIVTLNLNKHPCRFPARVTVLQVSCAPPSISYTT